MSSIPESGSSLGEGNGNPLQYSCQGNSTDRGTWQATVHEVAKSWTAAAAGKPLQSCLTLCNPIDGSPPGSTVHGIFQARVLEWGATAFCLMGIGAFYPDLMREFYFYNKMSGKKIKKCLH